MNPERLSQATPPPPEQPAGHDSPDGDGYELLDSGGGRKLERFGSHSLVRPAAHAIWPPRHPERWTEAVATFDRDGGLHWSGRERLPEAWQATVAGIRFRLSVTDFGHLGIFPEQATPWAWLRETCAAAPEPLEVLNLFAYSGGATLAALQGGARVCHLDASRGMVDWARANAQLNALQDAPCRWIVDDAMKFLQRETRRGRHYDGIVLDPPSFGRGKSGEVFKIEDRLWELLDLCRKLLSRTARFVLLSCHTPGYTPVVLQTMLAAAMEGTGGGTDAGELLLTGDKDVPPLPSGTFARWIGPASA